MSYFMLTFGEKIDMSDFSPVKLVQVSEAQTYLHPIAHAVCTESKMPAFLIDDGENQTSDLFIDDAENILMETGSFEGSVLFKVIQRLALKGHAILIWWANNNPLAYQNAHRCTSLEMLLEFAAEQVKSNGVIQVYLPPNLSFKRDAGLPRSAHVKR